MAPKRKLFALVTAVALVASVFAPGALAATGAANTETGNAGNAGDAETVSVTTGAAENVTNESATLSGAVSGLGNAQEATVGFQYWAEGAGNSPTATDGGTATEDGTFEADVSGLEGNTTYTYVAVVQVGNADAGNVEVVKGSEATFTTDRDPFVAPDGPFGHGVARFAEYLKSSDDVEERNLGQAISKWVRENNPGADNRPDHAGPHDDDGDEVETETEDDDDDRGKPDHAGPKDKGEKDRGRPDHAGPKDGGDDDDDGDEVETETEDDDDETEDAETDDDDSDDESDDDDSDDEEQTATPTPE